ncbi:MAG TPA: hypothetical protein VF713_13745 [Thermoanaerobaculia bacterium]
MLDGAVLVRAAQRGERVDDALLDPSRIRLLGGLGFLIIERAEVEQPVALQRTAEREACLRLRCGELRGGRAVRILRLAAQRVVLEGEMRCAVQIVRARLRDDVDEAGHRASELGIGAVGDDDHLFHGVEVEGEWRPLSAALLAEERVVEVGAIDGDVVRNTFLTVDRQLVAVGSLHDRDAGGWCPFTG